jgi:hypothetical protein
MFLRNLSKLLLNYTASHLRIGLQISVWLYLSEFQFSFGIAVRTVSEYLLCFRSLVRRNGGCRRTDNRVQFGSSSNFEASHIFDAVFLRLDKSASVLLSTYRTPQPISQSAHRAWKLGRRSHGVRRNKPHLEGLETG